MMDRRAFIKSLSRSLVVGGMLAGGVYLTLRKGEEGEECNFDFVCKNCKQIEKCTLSEATDFKNNNRNKEG